LRQWEADRWARRPVAWWPGGSGCWTRCNSAA